MKNKYEFCCVALILMVIFLGLAHFSVFGQENQKDDPFRPQFHFTAPTGAISDPNGLFYYDGIYHLFFQFNPDNIQRPVPQHWGHAISRDLIHWEHLPIAINPHKGGDIWSGSAIVDYLNTSGLQKEKDPPILAFYTWQKDFTQRMVYSHDQGKTWTEYDKNPVLDHIYNRNRDPLVFWHSESNNWIMVLFVKGFYFFSSDDLINWGYLSNPELDLHECPDFFELPVDGDENNTRWVLLDALGRYYTGKFDGTRFIPEYGPYLTDWNKREFYATQTWKNMPGKDWEVIQIACLRDDRHNTIPSEIFQSQMTFPVNLTLHNTDEGIRMFRYPIPEIEELYVAQHIMEKVNIECGQKIKIGEGELLDIKASIIFNEGGVINFNIRDTEIRYDSENHELVFDDIKVPIDLIDGKLNIRLLVDKSSIEVYGNKGIVSISKYYLPGETRDIYIKSERGMVVLDKLEFNKLRSIWH